MKKKSLKKNFFFPLTIEIIFAYDNYNKIYYKLTIGNAILLNRYTYKLQLYDVILANGYNCNYWFRTKEVKRIKK